MPMRHSFLLSYLFSARDVAQHDQRKGHRRSPEEGHSSHTNKSFSLQVSPCVITVAPEKLCKGYQK